MEQQWRISIYGYPPLLLHFLTRDLEYVPLHFLYKLLGKKGAAYSSHKNFGQFLNVMSKLTDLVKCGLVLKRNGF